jgi:hypothetical protein
MGSGIATGEEIKELIKKIVQGGKLTTLSVFKVAIWLLSTGVAVAWNEKHPICSFSKRDRSLGFSCS